MKLRSFDIQHSQLLQWGLPLIILFSFYLETSSLQAKDYLLDKGRRIYIKQCAHCHGVSGEGVEDEYPDPLSGKMSKKSLAKLITKTMPDEEPNDCIGQDASAVAYYLYKKFYSPAAQARLHPVHTEVSRLTIRQFRYSVADLLSDKQGKAIRSEQRGLKSVYFNSRNFKGDTKIHDRIDSNINFDYKAESPDEKIKKDEFSIQWNGSLIAPETGEYEILLETPNGVKLWLNDYSKPMIDGWVASGDRTPNGTIFLLAGRAYPLRIKYFKYKEKLASIKLVWKLPSQIKQVIPNRYLTPESSPVTVIASTKFPPDDKSEGYIRGNSVSKEWLQAVVHSSMEVADHVSTHLKQFVKVNPGHKEYREKVRIRCVHFVERAFRLKLNNAAKKHFIYQYLDGAKEIDVAVRKVIIHTIQSPFFLYRFMNDKGSSTEIASKLALVLWDSIPDAELLKVAFNDTLKNPDVLNKQLDRMVHDPKTTAKLQAFVLDWLHVDQFQELSKDKKLFPKFNEELISDLKVSLNLSLDEILKSKKADFRVLLLSSDLYLNKNLSDYYQIPSEAKDEFIKVNVNSIERAGLISHPYIMAGFAYHKTSSPIHRGVFIAKNVLGRRLKPPKDAISPLPPDAHPDLTTRELITLQTTPQACVRCHELINPLGFPMENYDAVGRYQLKDNGKDIDSSGGYESLDEKIAYFKGARELVEYLAKSPEVHAAFVEKLFRYSVKQPILAFGVKKQDKLVKSFVKNDFNIYSLLKEIAKTSSNISKKK